MLTRFGDDGKGLDGGLELGAEVLVGHGGDGGPEDGDDAAVAQHGVQIGAVPGHGLAHLQQGVEPRGLGRRGQAPQPRGKQRGRVRRREARAELRVWST